MENKPAIKESKLPPPSAIQLLIESHPGPANQKYDKHLQQLALLTAHNLHYQHNWTEVKIHYRSSANETRTLPRPVVSGLPPTRLYIHPDEQIELLQKQKDEGKTGMPDLELEREWVLPSHLREPWTLRRFGEMFDSLSIVPSDEEGEVLFEEDSNPRTANSESRPSQNGESTSNSWRTKQPKRLLLATVDDDSTIVYYIIHDGIVKPRQN